MVPHQYEAEPAIVRMIDGQGLSLVVARRRSALAATGLRIATNIPTPAVLKQA